MSSFAEQIGLFVFKTKERLEATHKQAALSLANAANDPKQRMRYRTGFLHNSLNANVGSMPSGPSVGPKMGPGGTFTLVDPMGNPDIEGKVMSWTFNAPLFIGWTANYAPKREAIDYFLGEQVRIWPQHVRRAVTKAKVQFP